jgi:HD-GYP domain-containing protein (c-di-GMP phosphodiesterase class II)
MSMTFERPVLPGLPSGTGFEGPSRELAWEVLERFASELQSGGRRSRPTRQFLGAVREGVQADVAFVYERQWGDGMDVVGDPTPSPDWCRRLARRLLEGAPTDGSGRLLRSGSLGPGEPPLPPPHSAAAVRLSRSRQVWLVAVSFDPRRQFDPTDLKVMGLAKQLLSNQNRQADVYSELKETLFGLIRCLSATIDAKDPYTCGHSERVARIAVRLAQEMSLPEEEVSNLYIAGLLHDIGKIGIRDAVLQKPGRLTEEEAAHVKEHPVIGDQIISNVKKLSHLRPGVRSHHERYDGRGYPDGLAGEAIPLMARIVAVADACDAMLSSRRYRAALPVERVSEIMSEGAGTQWDPRVVRHFMAARGDIYQIGQQGLGQSVLLAVGHVVGGGSRDDAEPASQTLLG